MTTLAHTHTVNICGENFSIRADVPSNQIDKIAGYVDYKIKEVAGNKLSGDRIRLTVLAAMNIAGEYFDIKNKLEEYEKFCGTFDERMKTLTDSLDKAIQVEEG